MAFCPQCGTQITEFPCQACGANIPGRDLPDTESQPSPDASAQHAQDAQQHAPMVRLVLDPDVAPSVEERGAAEPDDEATGATGTTVYRRTQFRGGMLVLTNEDLTLYNHAGTETIKSMPIYKIHSCQNKNDRLIVTGLLNVEDNYAAYMRKLDKGINKINTKWAYSGHKSGMRARLQERKMNNMIKERDKLKTDPEFRHKIKRKQADKYKDEFTLPENLTYSEKEYKIWAHAINRLVVGVKKLRITTTPPNALVLVDGTPCGISPCIIDKPLTDRSAVQGEYTVEALLEGHKSKKGTVDAKLNAGPGVLDLVLERADERNGPIDERVQSERGKFQEESLGYDPEWAELEAIGISYKMVLMSDSVVMANPESGHDFMSLSYGQIKHASLKTHGVFHKVTLGLLLEYDTEDFPNMEEIFVLNPDAYDNQSEIKHRYDALDRYMQKKIKEWSQGYPN